MLDVICHDDTAMNERVASFWWIWQKTAKAWKHKSDNGLSKADCDKREASWCLDFERLVNAEGHLKTKTNEKKDKLMKKR